MTTPKKVTLEIELSDKAYEVLKILAKDRGMTTADYAQLGLYTMMYGQIDDSYYRDKRKQSRYFKIVRQDWNAWAGDNKAKQGEVEASDYDYTKTCTEYRKKKATNKRKPSESQLVNIMQDIERVMVKSGQWTEFKKRLEASGQTVEKYFTASINNELENALELNPEVLEPQTEPARKEYYRKYWPGYLDKMAELKKRYLEA